MKSGTLPRHEMKARRDKILKINLSMKKMIEISNLSKSYPSPDGEEAVNVFSGVDLEVEEGSSVAIVGPSGSGKSTLLNIIGLLDKPTDGKLIVAQKDLIKLREVKYRSIETKQWDLYFRLIICSHPVRFSKM